MIIHGYEGGVVNSSIPPQAREFRGERGRERESEWSVLSFINNKSARDGAEFKKNIFRLGPVCVTPEWELCVV